MLPGMIGPGRPMLLANSASVNCVPPARIAPPCEPMNATTCSVVGVRLPAGSSVPSSMSS